jgi:PAS domain S-box-containing protein
MSSNKTAKTSINEGKLNDDYSKLEAVLNTVIDGIITIDSHGVIQSFNRSAEHIFGYTACEVIGCNIKILMPEPYHSEHDGYLKNHHETGDKKIIGIGREVKAQRKNGDVFSIELGVNEMATSGEKMFVGSIRDISDRKQAEQELRDNQAKLQAIVDNTVDGLITIDEKGYIETFNRACEQIFGYKFSEVMGQNVKILMPAPYHGEHDGYLKNYHDTGTKKIIGMGREVKGQRKDGSTFPLDLSVSEVNVQGRRLYSGIVRDISDRKEAEENIMQANAELEEFSYRTSHDLRSPLVSSIGLLNVVAEAIKEDNKEVALESVAFVQKSLLKLENLVKDILQLTKTKNIQEEKELVNLSAISEESISKFKNMDNFERLDIQTDLRFFGNLQAEKSRVVLIIENLISNAIKYQDTNKANSFIKISSYQEKNNVVLEVRDNGLGVPKKQQNNMFKMFKRFHPRTSFGSGLGLYMMKKSADVLKGNIHYEDSGDGSVFKLKLPLADLSKVNY